MLDARLPLALDAGLIDAPVAIVGAAVDTDLSALPERPDLVVTRQPDFDRFTERGFTCHTAITDAPATIIVRLPRERALARDRIARAMATGARVIVDGQKTDGIDSMLKACRARGEVGDVISKAHGKIFAMTGGDFSNWIADPARNADGYWTAPGSFSADAIDPGSAALSAALAPLEGTVADLGAGWGYLSHRALRSPAIEAIHLVEADLPSLDCARRNVDDPRAVFHWADATAWTPPEPIRHVITNPPFHKGRAGAPELGRAFIANAARILAPRGTLWMVANRHLPYEAALTELFAEVAELPGTTAFKLYRAARPRRKR
ncbi:class I SAM-dependent methyltransferase [Maribius pontilimi]|uniref:Class I SAM-dependent methyltransferase n=1 Tax=Palleronia pontilimi TaxID=1964209 RepID=A0A934IEV1_9RHOB|nr:methyltransferase [Palleronia pontilimi]MBJ3761315.1 class I SAM-dependent methyltransferase [Palleronia pontilimi]